MRARLPFLLLCLLSLFVLFAAYWAMRMAWADHLFRSNTPEGVQRAVELMPMNSKYQFRAGNLRRAVELNPYMSAAWMELGFEAEAKGDYAEAERHLLQAARVDRTFEPRWALANYYYRRERPDAFWYWLRLAAERSFGDRAALFRLAWRASADADAILSQAIPDDGAVLEQYVRFLMEQPNRPAALSAAKRLLRTGAASGQPALLDLCDQMLEAWEPAAMEVWNGLIANGLLAGPALDPGNYPLTNGSLAAKPLGRGFDWRPAWRAGVDSRWAASEKVLRISLSGTQQEQTELLAQYLPVLPGASYRVYFRYRTDGIRPASGIHWRIARRDEPDGPSGEDLHSGQEDWRDGRFEFQAKGGLARLELVYQRRRGTVRTEGTIDLGRFRMERLK